MTHHPITGDQRRWLQGELTAWQAEQIISAGQAERILARYETAADAGRRKQSQAVFTLLGLAALRVGLAVLLLIGYNWELLPRAAKLAVILTVLAGVHGAGFYLRFRRQAR